MSLGRIGIGFPCDLTFHPLAASSTTRRRIRRRISNSSKIRQPGQTTFTNRAQSRSVRGSPRHLVCFSGLDRSTITDRTLDSSVSRPMPKRKPRPAKQAKTNAATVSQDSNASRRRNKTDHLVWLRPALLSQGLPLRLCPEL